MADEQAPDDFELALNDLLASLIEGGAEPQRAAAAVSEVAQRGAPSQRMTPQGLEVDIGSGPVEAATSRLPRPQKAQVGAGQYGLPSMPPVAQNALAGPPQGVSMTSQIQNRAMRGLEPTADQAVFLNELAPEKEARGERLGSLGLELTGVPQMGRAGSAVSEAVSDPSIPNVTNAAVQTGIAAFRPAAALKALGVGYGAGAAADLGAFDMSADAQAAKKGSAAPREPLPGLTPALQAEYDAAQKRLSEGGFSSGAERRQLEKTVEELRAASIDFVKNNASSARGIEEKKRTAEQAEYNRRVEVAEASKASELARDVRFRDTTPGQIYEKTAGFTPFLAAAGLSGLNRAAAGKMFGKENALAAPAMGAAEGLATAHTPLAAEAYLITPALNPEKEGYRKYARDLPKGHPEKEDAAAYARGLPEENPVRTLAAKELYDPWKFAERSAIGVVEGALGQKAGPYAVDIGGRMADATKSGLGWLLRGPKGPQGAGATPSAAPSGTQTGANALSQPSTAGAASSAGIQPQSASRNALAGPETPQRQLPSPEASPSPRAQQSTSDRPWWAGDPPDYIRLKPGEHWDLKMKRVRREDGTTSKTRYIPPGTKNQ